MVALLVAAAVIGFATGRSSTPDSTTPPPTPAATETVVVEKTVTANVMPESCARALDSMAKIINQADVVAGHDGQQLDIMSEAYQAIYLKDWNRLNELSDKQRKMWFDLTEETSSILPEISDIQKDIDECNQKAPR